MALVDFPRRSPGIYKSYARSIALAISRPRTGVPPPETATYYRVLQSIRALPDSARSNRPLASVPDTVTREPAIFGSQTRCSFLFFREMQGRITGTRKNIRQTLRMFAHFSLYRITNLHSNLFHSPLYHTLARVWIYKKVRKLTLGFILFE